jgi:predicted metal-dependent peptidase
LIGLGGSPDELIRHEVEHLLRDHDGRRGDRDAAAWIQACDEEINDDLELTRLPRGALIPSVTGLTAEEYYSEHESEHEACTCGGGSGAGNKLPDELPDDEMSSQEISESLRDSVAAAIREASKAGNVPESLVVWADARAQRNTLRVDPLIVARRVCQQLARGTDDYSYARHNKRQQGALILPGNVRSLPRVAVVLDTSGSMSQHGDWIASVLQIIGRSVAGAVLIDCDCAVHCVRRLRSWRDARKAVGGGGTDMRTGMLAAERLGYKSILVLTDGETPWPEKWLNGSVAIMPNGVVKRD